MQKSNLEAVEKMPFEANVPDQPGVPASGPMLGSGTGGDSRPADQWGGPPCKPGQYIRPPLRDRACLYGPDGEPWRTSYTFSEQGEMKLHWGLSDHVRMVMEFCRTRNVRVREFELVINESQFSFEAYYHSPGMLPDVTERLVEVEKFFEAVRRNQEAVSKSSRPSHDETAPASPPGS